MTYKKKAKANYQNGKIYKIVNDVNDKIYIGSTTQMLCKRMSCHRAFAKDQTSNIYAAMREIGVSHFKILLIESFPCNSKSELEAREYEILNTFDKAICYNSLWNGKPDETARARMRENCCNKGKNGEANHLFKPGSICSNNDSRRNKEGWRFTWWDAGKKKSKSFYICQKRTAQQAYLAAVDKQNEIFPLQNKHYLRELPIELD